MAKAEKSGQKDRKSSSNGHVQVDGDFKAEIVFSTNNDTGFKVDAGIEVWGDRADQWVPTRPVWNQHTYHITNSGIAAEIPLKEDDNWLTPIDKPYNSYRRNAQGTGDYCAPDLTLFELTLDNDICPLTGACVTVANIGCLGVGPGVKVSFYEEELGLLGVVETAGAIIPGASEQVCLSTNDGKVNGSIWAVVDDDGEMKGKFSECVEDNNATPKIPLCFSPN